MLAKIYYVNIISRNIFKINSPADAVINRYLCLPDTLLSVAFLTNSKVNIKLFRVAGGVIIPAKNSYKM